MFENKQRVIVTGGNGFIGKHFIIRALELGHEVTNLDNLAYAADKKMGVWFYGNANYSLLHGDITSINSIPEVDVVINFAAESHVDNSIRGSRHFTQTNTNGVQNLLELIRTFEPSLRPLLVQISTDEVYGDSLTETFDEESPLRPSNPYAASKAAAEHIVRSYERTYGINYQIIRMSNNYGRRQYPEKLIARSIARFLHGKKALLHGDGSYRRSWLHVEDAVEGILKVITDGNINDTYNISSGVEMNNNEVIRKITDFMELDFSDSVEYVLNRPGQDLRYLIEDRKIRALGWQPKKDFDKSLRSIISETRTDPHWGSMAPALVGNPVPYPENYRPD